MFSLANSDMMLSQMAKRISKGLMIYIKDPTVGIKGTWSAKVRLS